MQPTIGAHCPLIHGFAAAARATPKTADRWTRHRFNTLTAYAADGAIHNSYDNVIPHTTRIVITL